MSEVFERGLAERVRRLTGALEPLPAAPVPGWLRARVRAALLAGETHYTDRPGIPELRRALAERISELGLERTAADVIVTSGEKEALFVSLLALSLEAGDATVAFDRCAHRELFELLDFSPAPAGETGPSRVRYVELGDGEPPVFSEAGAAHRVVNLGSALLAELPGWLSDDDPIVIGNLDALEGLDSFRVGFVCAPSEIAKRVRPWKQTLSICTASPSQRAAYEAWRAARGGER